MCRRCIRHARIAKPSAGLTPEEDAARLVLAWERRMIRNGRAWRKPNPNGPTAEKRSTFTWLAPPEWTRHPDYLDPVTARWVPGPLVSVQQSTLVLRPEGCTCPPGAYAVWGHVSTCDLMRARACSIERNRYAPLPRREKNAAGER